MFGLALVVSRAVTAQSAAPPSPDDQYVLGPDSKPQSGVPEGKTFKFTYANSTVFPGTSRTITVYVPAQYTGERPACVYVGLDNLGFNVRVVFDNLIAQNAMPVTIAIGVSPGIDATDADSNPRYNRSFEFDSRNGNLARFLTDEILPEVERHTTPDGLPIRLSGDPNDRAVGGGSTGGIGAFTLAWEHPDAFRRVFSAIGTYVGMRGGDAYLVLVRKTEPKPIRIFLEDGSHDEWMGGPEFGDWWMSNQTFERALEFAGYAVEHAWGEGTHSGQHADAIFPDAMRWLWKDWPQPVTHSESQSVSLRAIVQPGADWQVVPDGRSSGVLTTDRDGHVHPGPDRDAMYVTEPAAGRLWFIAKNGARRLLDSTLQRPTAVVFSPDHRWLAVGEHDTHWGYSYRVQPDGTVRDKQRFYWFHVPDTADNSGVTQWVADRDGRLYAATRMGVQVFDRAGRVRAILPVPGGEVTGVTFGEAGFHVLYVSCADGKIYRRTLQVTGVLPWAEPVELTARGAP
jgi:gluconolactonase